MFAVTTTVAFPWDIVGITFSLLLVEIVAFFCHIIDTQILEVAIMDTLKCLRIECQFTALLPSKSYKVKQVYIDRPLTDLAVA